MNRNLLLGACTALVSTVALAQPRAMERDARAGHEDRREAHEERRNLAQLEALLGRMDRARASGFFPELRRVDTELQVAVRDVAADARVELEHSRREVHQDARELRHDERREAWTGSVHAEREANGDRHEIAKDEHAVRVHQDRLARVDGIETDLNRLYGRMGPGEMLAKRSLLVELIDITRGELSTDRHEAREDGREMNRDLRR